MSTAGVIGIVAGVIVLLGLIVLGLFNGLVKARNMADESWSGVDVQLKRRRDLIPNLVSTVQAYATHERTTFDAVTQARAAAEGAGNAAQGVPAENMLTAALTGLFGVAEAYPDLKANANFLDLQNQLTNIEDNVAAARSIYNGNARNYNDKVQSFPNNLVAGALGFKRREYFEADLSDIAPATVGF
jgi:LemA protein